MKFEPHQTDLPSNPLRYSDLLKGNTVLLELSSQGDEMDQACGTYGEKCTQGFGAETWRKNTTYKS
jgi:hypothetical protein